MAQYMHDIIDEEDRGRLHDNLLVGPSKLPMEVVHTSFAVLLCLRLIAVYA